MDGGRWTVTVSIVAGNRRTASVRSVGYSDLFVLTKKDMWDVLKVIALSSSTHKLLQTRNFWNCICISLIDDSVKAEKLSQFINS